MLGTVIRKSKNFFPAGYKYKTGELVRGKDINVPSGVIPLTVKLISGGSTANTGGYEGVNITVRDNIKNPLLQGSSHTYLALTAGAMIDMFASHNFNWSELEKVTNIYSATSKLGGHPVISIVAWLEKIGGGGVLNSLIKNGNTFLRKVVSNMLGRVVVNGSNVIKVFHDGKFYINPISNSWLLENKELISPNHSIMQFNFNDNKDKVLFIDYYTVSEDGELTVSSDTGYANGFQKNLYGSGIVKRTICTKVKKKTTITGATLNVLNRRTFHIKSIWLEKVGG